MTRFALFTLLCLVLAPLPVRAAAVVVHHDLSVSLDPESRTVSIRDHITLTGGGLAAFRLDPMLTVGWATVDGQPAEARAAGGVWTVPLGAQGNHLLTLSYRGQVAPISGRGGGYLLAGTEGVYLGGGWVPAFGDDGRFTYRITVDAPEPYKAVAPGRLIEEQTGGRYMAVFDFPHPTGEVSLFAGPWTVVERMHGDIRLRTYLDSPVADMADAYLAASTGYIDMYAEMIGPYPFSAFHVLSGPLPVGWGFPGLTYIGTRVLRLPFVLNRSLGHEILHNWWGNGVYIDYDSGNWAEGLTTYLADHLYAERESPDKAREMRLAWLRDYAALPPERDVPVTAFRSKLHAASQVIGYNKVAHIFHMLRKSVGDIAFAAGLRRLWNDKKFAVAGWLDLRRSFETASGRDLGTFFDQWLNRPGAPKLTLVAAEAGAADGAGRHRLDLELRADGGYRMAVPLRIDTGAGPHFHTMALDGGTARRGLWLDLPPRRLAVDPDFDLFRRLDPAEAPPILRDVTLDRATRAVLLVSDETARNTALQLAWRLMEGAPNVAPADAPVAESTPLLVLAVGAEAVDGFLSDRELPPRPDTLTGRGSARVWAARDGGGRPLVTVEAESAEALADLLRPLPHYGRRGYLVFENAKAVDVGNWPAGDSPLVREFGPREEDPAPTGARVDNGPANAHDSEQNPLQGNP